MQEQDRGPADARPTAHEAGPPDSLEALVPKRRLWPVFAVLGAIVAVLGFLGYRSLTAPDPLRILVAIDLDGYWWEGSEPAAKLADALSAQLGELGFDPVKGGDPKVMKVLEKAKDPRVAAKQLGAGFIIEARLAPEVVEHPVKEGYFEVRVDAPVTLTYLENGTASEGRIRGYTGAPKKDQAMALLADNMASHALDAVIAQLVEHPAVVEITSGSDVKLLERLQPARTFAKDRAKRLADAAAAYTDLAAKRTAAGQGKVTFHSHPAAEDLLVGVGEGGYFVKTTDVSAFYSHRHRDLLRSDALETVAFRPFDAPLLPTTDPAAPKPMWKGYHVFTYPSASREGDRVALVEDLFGWAKTVTMVDKAGVAKRVRVDPEHRFVDPHLAPGGRFVAVYDRPAAGAIADLMVLETEGGKEVFGFHTENDSIRGYTWIDATRLLLVYTPEQPANEPQHVAVVDLAKQPYSIQQVYKAKADQIIGMPAASRDGATVVCGERGSEQGGLAVFDTATWQHKLLPVGYVDWPKLSPDGKHAVFETGDQNGHTVAAVVTLATGAVKKLPQVGAHVRQPTFSADGKRVLFEVRDMDPVFPRARGLSRIASVAFEP